MGERDSAAGAAHSLGVARTAWFDLDLPPDAVHFGVPSLTATIVLAFDRPTDVGWADEASHAGYRVLVAGLHTRPSLVRTHGRQHGMQLALSPWGVRTLLGVPLSAITRHILELGDLPTAPLHRLLTPVLDAPEQARPAMLRRELVGLAGSLDHTRAHRPRPEVVEAWRLIRTSRGNESIDAIARAVGWSRRHLTTQFAGEFGLRPKEAARIARFETARALAREGLDLATVAATAGYADQSHLTRDWTAITGRPPARSLRTEFPNVQDLTGAGGAE
ncbi:AraC family transcriptional regulator [Ruania alkalisoli]|uniref:AraC family transcriptional regulator n=1 Tax=Ruania alkalisoli TaxID=2779775 RepID=A0A7M1SP60_9MICO|nr:AraC family transcriptional regulator [Ruania alkalisoli]QOR69265.1 AraC family transcriptional regulator [Ruania alkalisoli]